MNLASQEIGPEGFSADIPNYSLSIEGVSVQLGESKILDRVTFRIKTGSIVGIIGPNGSGKTTLFNALSGFLPLSEGTIKFGESEVQNLSASARAKHGLGRVFQNSGVFREMTLLENILVALESERGLVSSIIRSFKDYKLIREEAQQYLELVGLQDKANKKAASLSGGQLRLLEIIRLVAFKSKICLLDEPTAGVSPKMKDSVAELIRKLQQMGKTVLVIEHDTGFIHSFSSRILVLDGGKLVIDQAPEKIRDNPLLKEIYFGA